jgi:hypothetical protein
VEDFGFHQHRFGLSKSTEQTNCTLWCQLKYRIIKTLKCVISGFRCEAGESSLLRYYAASSGNSLTDVSGKPAGPKMSVRYYHYSLLKAPYTFSVKLSDFTVWSHTWRKNWVNCAVLTGNSAGLRTVLPSRLSHRELRSSLRESHSFLSLPADTTMASSLGTDKNWQKNWQTWWETCAVPVNIHFSLSCRFFHTVKLYSLALSELGT